MTNPDKKRARGINSPGIPDRKQPIYKGDWALHPNVLKGKWIYRPLVGNPHFDGVVDTMDESFFVINTTTDLHKLDRERRYLDRRLPKDLSRLANAQGKGKEIEKEYQGLINRRRQLVAKGLKLLDPQSSDNEYRKVIQDAEKLNLLAGDEAPLKEARDKYRKKVMALAQHPERVPTSSNQQLLLRRLRVLQELGGEMPQVADSLAEPKDPEEQKSIDQQTKASEFESLVRRSYRPISPRHFRTSKRKSVVSDGTEDKGIRNRGTSNDVDDGTGASPEGKDRRSTSSGIDDVARGLALPSSRSKKGKPKRTPPPQPEPEFEFVGPPAPVSIRRLSREEAERKRSEIRKKRLKTFIGDIWDWLSDPEREWEEEQERMRQKWSTSAGANKRG